MFIDLKKRYFNMDGRGKQNKDVVLAAIRELKGIEFH